MRRPMSGVPFSLNVGSFFEHLNLSRSMVQCQVGVCFFLGILFARTLDNHRERGMDNEIDNGRMAEFRGHTGCSLGYVRNYCLILLTRYWWNKRCKPFPTTSTP